MPTLGCDDGGQISVLKPTEQPPQFRSQNRFIVESGEQRLIEAITSNESDSASNLLDVVEKSLLNFVQDMPPADDLTMLVLRRV